MEPYSHACSGVLPFKPVVWLEHRQSQRLANCDACEALQPNGPTKLNEVQHTAPVLF